MKRKVLWVCAAASVVAFCVWVTAQTELETPETPTFSEGQLEAAFDTCRALAKQAEETQRAFPMKYGLTEEPFDEPFNEQLERCVLSVLRGDALQIMPLG